MRVSVVEAWRVLYEGNVDEVLLPGEDGEVCVLDFHHPFLYRLRKGAIQLMRRTTREGTRALGGREVESRILIADGVAKMTGNELVILVDTPSPIAQGRGG